MNAQTSATPLDFYKNAPSVYAAMSRRTWWAVRLTQAVIYLVLIPLLLLGFGVLSLKWVAMLNASGQLSNDIEPMMALLNLISAPLIMFLFVLRPILSKLRMYAVYYIPYSAANSKGKAVITHYRKGRYKTLFSNGNGKEYGRLAPASGARVFNIPYEYARECYWEHIRNGGKVSNCPKLIFPEEHERSLFDIIGGHRSRLWLYQAPSDVVQTEGFKRSVEAAKRIVIR